MSKETKEQEGVEKQESTLTSLIRLIAMHGVSGTGSPKAPVRSPQHRLANNQLSAYATRLKLCVTNGFSPPYKAVNRNWRNKAS